MFKALFILVVVSLCMGATNCAKFRVRADAEAASLAISDESGLIQGCGQQLVSGLTYCKKEEGEIAGDAITFVAPPAHCLGDGPCASFKIYFPDNTPTYGDTIPQGQTSKAVTWSQLLGGRTAFAQTDRGLWPFHYWLKWIDQDGREETSEASGEIVLRVYAKGHVPLDHIETDPNFVWEWIQDGAPVKMTSSMRVWIGVRPQPAPSPSAVK